MNFQTILEELNRLYEEESLKTNSDSATEEQEKEEVLTEAAEEEIELEVVDDEQEADELDTEDAPKQVVLECANCGGLVIKTEADVAVDEKTDLANMAEACQYCEETAGYTIVGEVVPYEAEADKNETVEIEDTDDFVAESVLTEGKIADAVKKVVTRVGADAATVLRVFTELGDMVTGKDSKLYDMAEYIENKATLKALLSGNEKVMNSLTKDDIEELEDDISDYERAKEAAKDGKTLKDVGGKAKNQRQLYDVLSENEDGEPEAIAVGLYKNAAEKRAAEKEKQLGRKCWVEPSGNA
jgi:hypothetical protein